MKENKKAAYTLLTLLMVAVLIGVGAIAYAYRYDKRDLEEHLSIEGAASVQPPLRLIPLEEGRVLACWTFPVKDYENRTRRCIACEEQHTEDTLKRPISMDCK